MPSFKLQIMHGSGMKNQKLTKISFSKFNRQQQWIMLTVKVIHLSDSKNFGNPMMKGSQKI